MKTGIISVKDLKRLVTINKNLTNIGIRACNGFYSERSAAVNMANKEKFKQEAAEILEKYGFLFYYQSDPRGVAVYAIPKEEAEGRYAKHKEMCNRDKTLARYESLDRYIDSHYNQIGFPIY